MKKISNFLFDNINLVVVSKNRTPEEILKIYNEGQLDFGENRVQELISKQEILPSDVKWHLIGHLQTNKVKYIAPFVHLIHSVDSLKLLKEIDKCGKKNNRIIDFLFQVKIAEENTKFGMTERELENALFGEDFSKMMNVNLKGIMGMATATTDKEQIKSEFLKLKSIFNKVNDKFELDYLSMGMSSDYKEAIDCGSNMIRVGSAIFNK